MRYSVLFCLNVYFMNKHTITYSHFTLFAFFYIVNNNISFCLSVVYVFRLIAHKEESFLVNKEKEKMKAYECLATVQFLLDNYHEVFIINE